MNIIENTFTVYGMTMGQIAQLRDFWLRHHDRLPCEPLTFDHIRKNCVAGDALLISDRTQRRYVFIGWGIHGELIVQETETLDIVCFEEGQIKGWAIGEKFKR